MTSYTPVRERGSRRNLGGLAVPNVRRSEVRKLRTANLRGGPSTSERVGFVSSSVRLFGCSVVSK